jgi:ribosomal-protein-alanine N-acetyltransferase
MSAILSPGAFEVRMMLEDDLPEVMSIERRAYKHHWTMGIFRDCLRVGYFCQVMLQDNQIVAYGVMSHGAGEAHVLNICVRPERQGEGIGRVMMESLVTAARRIGAETLLLEVRPSNKPAVRLYHSMGFNEVGSRKNYYPDGDRGREDALLMGLSL